MPRWPWTPRRSWPRSSGSAADLPVPLLDLVLHLLIDHPVLFDATPPTPLRDLLLVAGLDVDGTTVHRADLRPPPEAPTRSASPGSASPRRWPPSGCSPRSSRWTSPRSPTTCSTPSPTPTRSPRRPSRSSVATSCRRSSWPASSSTSRRRPDPASLSGTAFLRSRLAEWQGDPAAQEAALDAARGGQQPAALVDAAWFAADRGDARAALALLRSAHVPADDPDLELLVRYTSGGPEPRRPQRSVLVRRLVASTSTAASASTATTSRPGRRGSTRRP